MASKSKLLQKVSTSTIYSCALLSQLHIYQNKLTDLSSLSENQTLTILDASANNLQSLDSLPALMRLRTLLLSDNPLATFDSLSNIAHLSLTHLSLASPMY